MRDWGNVGVWAEGGYGGTSEKWSWIVGEGWEESSFDHIICGVKLGERLIGLEIFDQLDGLPSDWG